MAYQMMIMATQNQCTRHVVELAKQFMMFAKKLSRQKKI